MTSHDDMPEDHPHAPTRELRGYLVGFLLAAALTVAAFALVASGSISGAGGGLAVLGGLALVQIAVHFRFFLRIDLAKSHRDDLQLILFTGLIVTLMVGGSIWILWDQHARMGG